MYRKMQAEDLGDIMPRGWIKDFLATQANGLTGRLEHAGYPYSIAFWKGETRGAETPPWEVFEQTAYRLDGMYCCGVLTGREDLSARADESFSYTLQNVSAAGVIGSGGLRATDRWPRWPLVVYFRALIAKYEYTHDDSIVRALADFYLKNKYDYSTKREFLHIECMLWAYEKTGDERLLALAERTYADYNRKCADDNCEAVMLSERKPYVHGVTHDETAKIGAILYMYTGNERYLRTSVHAFQKLDAQFMLADGGHGSNEFMLGNDSLQSHETCTVSDYTWALYYLLMATGDVQYADKIERCVFNAGIGAVKEDFTAVQYFSCPNQVLATQNSNHNAFFCGEGWMGYNAKHETDCCVGNVNRFMPNFVRRLWMRNGDEVFATLYAPCAYTFTAAGTRVVIEEQTNYPFEDTVSFTVKPDKPTDFTLSLRIPLWSNGATVTVNGESQTANRSGFYAVKRTFSYGDTVTLSLNPHIQMQNSPDGGIFFTRGSLIFALGLPQKETPVPIVGGDGDLFNYDMTTDAAWNFGVDFAECEDELTLERSAVAQNPWSLAGVPLRLNVPAHRLSDWRSVHAKKVTQIYDLYEKRSREKEGEFTFTPPLPKSAAFGAVGAKENIRLVPVGAAKLRVTVFPTLG